MPEFTAGLPADQVHEHLKTSLRELARVEKNALLWFAEVQERRLYRELGYSSIQTYASEALGFSQSKTYQFLRLAESLGKLPALRESVADGELSWTKAREVVKVATPRNEKRWLAEAMGSSRRELERKVKWSRDRTKTLRKTDRRQTSLLDPPASEEVERDCAEVPQRVTLSFTPEQFAHWEAMMEKIRKRERMSSSREELLLEIMADRLGEPTNSKHANSGGAATAPAESSGAGADDCTRVQSSPYQIVVYKCEDCGKGVLRTGRGREPLSTSALARIECDARILKPGERSSASIPPARRREVFARDGHRCRVQGCRSTRFLEIHHIRPRAMGGGNEAENLVTLCSRCHQLLHERGIEGLEDVVGIERAP